MNIHETAFIHPQATVIGLVEMGRYSSLWPGTVVRADMNRIVLGEGVNIQDNSTLHTDSSRGITVGDYTLVGHNTMLHGCKVGRGCLIGIGSIVLDEAEIGDGAMVMAGCTVRGGKKIPPGAMVIQKNGELKIFEGKAKPVLSVAGCLEYIVLSDRFKKGIFGPFTQEEEIEFQDKAKKILNGMGIPFKG